MKTKWKFDTLQVMPDKRESVYGSRAVPVTRQHLMCLKTPNMQQTYLPLGSRAISIPVV